MTWSIHRRLLAGLVSGVLLSGMISAAVIYVRARDEVDELFDRQLKQIALSLREQEDLSVTQPEPPYDQEEERIVVSAWDRQGLPVFGLARDRQAPAAGSEGYATVIWQSQPWRIYTGVGSGGTVEVAQPLATHEHCNAYRGAHSGADHSHSDCAHCSSLDHCKAGPEAAGRGNSCARCENR